MSYKTLLKMIGCIGNADMGVVNVTLHIASALLDGDITHGEYKLLLVRLLEVLGD